MRPIETRYARSGDVRIAYQVVGQGSIDLVFVPGFISNLDLHWEDEGYSRLLKRLSSFSRLILFDKRGTGLSDRVDTHHLPSLDTRMDDVRAVMDATGCGRAAILGASEGAPMAMLFAATYPERTRALVLYGGYAHFTQWWARFERLSASPTAAAALARMNAEIDVRGVLAAISAPTLLIHRRNDVRVDPDASRFLASRIPNAKLVEVPGRDHPIWTGDVDRVVDIIEQFLTGERAVSEVDRVLAALLVTRIYDTARMGDRMWSERSQRFQEIWRQQVGRHGGRLAGTNGEMMMSRFDGPARAIRCAEALREATQGIGVASAQGVHVGEVEVRGPRAGLTARVTMQLAAHAERGNILASRLVADMGVVVEQLARDRDVRGVLHHRAAG